MEFRAAENSFRERGSPGRISGLRKLQATLSLHVVDSSRRLWHKTGTGRNGAMEQMAVRVVLSGSAPVAQLDRASDFESAGRAFESPRVRHKFIPLGFLASANPLSDERRRCGGECERPRCRDYPFWVLEMYFRGLTRWLFIQSSK